MTPKKAIIYVRVSTSDQADRGVSLDNQESACYDWAYRNAIQPIKLFREEGASAKTLNRPQMQAMIRYLAEKGDEVDYVIVYQVDRLARNSVDFFDLVKLLGSHKIELRDSNSSVDASDSDELIQGMQALLAQHDNRLKSRRVTENMKRHALEGFRMHQAPFGLRNIRDELGRPTVEPIEPLATDIAHLLTEFAKGSFTKGQLFHEARRIGLVQKNGLPMSYQYLDKMLKQPLYAGLERSSLTDGELVPSAFVGIVPEWVYYINQQLLDGGKASKSDGYQSINPDYPLRKFVTCEDCGDPLRGSASTGRGGKKYPRYHCTNPACHSAYIQPDKLHEQFLELLEGRRPDGDRLGLIRTIITRVWRDEVKTMRTRRSGLRERVDKLQEQRTDATEKVVAGEITSDEKLALMTRLEQRLASIEGELAKLDRSIGTKAEAVDYALNYIGNAPRLWSDASTEMKQTYQRMLFPEGIPYNLRTKQFGTTKMSALYTFVGNQKGADAPSESSMVVPRGIEPRLLE
jgi:site-specific DNA recombinase